MAEPTVDQVYTRVAKVMFEHLGDAHLADRFISMTTLNSPEFHLFQKGEDADAIDKLIRTLSAVQKLLDEDISVGANSVIQFHIMLGAHAGGGDQEATKRYIEDTGKPAMEALDAIKDNIKVLRPALTNALRYVESSSSSIDLKRTNILEVTLIDAARKAWEDGKGKPAPKRDLNEATKFGKFLGDIFEACEARGKPRAAMKAWARILGE